MEGEMEMMVVVKTAYRIGERWVWLHFSGVLHGGWKKLPSDLVH
jgi:hypothetical protein